MKIGFMRTCFGCCSLRTGVLIVAIIDLILGMYEIIEFCVRVYLDLNHTVDVQKNSTDLTSNLNKNITLNETWHNTTTVSVFRNRGALYDDSAFAVIVVGCIDIFISSFLLYVAAFRKYDLRVVVFIAAIWSFVFAFLDMVSFAVFIALQLFVEMGSFLFSALLEIFFGYVILSYFKFMTVVVERGLDDMHMSYFPEEPISDVTEVQMDDAYNETLTMDDLNQDDFNDDDEQKLVIS